MNHPKFWRHEISFKRTHSLVIFLHCNTVSMISIFELIRRLVGRVFKEKLYTVITLCKATCYWKITITCKPKNMKCCFRLTHLIFTAEYLSLGTSNWAEDYFSTTAGVAFVFNAKSPVRKPGGGTETFNLRDQVKQL